MFLVFKNIFHLILKLTETNIVEKCTILVLIGKKIKLMHINIRKFYTTKVSVFEFKTSKF